MGKLNRTTVYAIVALILLALVGGAFMLLRGDEDDWRCENNRWEAHGHPFAPEPTKPCGTNQSGMVLVEAPRPGDDVHSPITIRGRAGSDWFSENGVHVVLVDWNGQVIAEGDAAKGSMTDDNLYSFAASLSYQKTQSNIDRGTLILQKYASSSGDSILDIPVMVK